MTIGKCHERLCELNDRPRVAKQLETWFESDSACHRQLLDASGLKPLLDLFFRRFRESVKRAEWKAGVESHPRLMDALRGGQWQDACDELREHIEIHKARI